jgi:CRISPR-associated protein Cas1
MRIAFIDKKNVALKVEYKSLKVDDKKIPLRLLDTLVLGTSCCLESKDILKMTKEGITLLFLSARSDDMAMTYSVKSKNPELKIAQYQAQEKALSLAKYFVGEKIKRHAEHLAKHGKVLDISKVLATVDSARTLQRLLGIEGSFSKRYFLYYFKLFPKKLQLGKRSRNPPLDPVNAMMSFFYMLIHNLITVRLLSFGFEPSIGFLHQPFRSHNALASDLMELFRADINEFVFDLFEQKKLESSDFTQKNGAYLKYDSRRRIWVGFQIFNQKLQLKIEKEIVILKVMIKEAKDA